MSILTSVEVISAEYASVLLKNNDGNRNVNTNLVDKYAAAMLRGEWCMNGEPIIVFDTGRIGDGQHRLLAIIKSGLAQNCLVVRGVSDTVFTTINNGRSRCAYDILTIAGHVNCHKAAAVARALVVYFDGHNYSRLCTNHEILRIVDQYPAIGVHVKMHSQLLWVKKEFPSSVMAYTMIASKVHGEDIIMEFLSSLNSGEGLKRGDPQLALRNRILSQSKNLTLSKLYKDALFIKAMNIYIRKREITLLKFADGEKFPPIFGGERFGWVSSKKQRQGE